MFTESPSTWRGELAATLRIAAPLALANLLQMLVYAMDVIFVARLGEEQLAASSLSIALFGLMMWCFSGLTGMVAALIAAELGSRRHAVREVRRSARMALWLAVVCGLAGMAVCWFGREIMLVTGQQPHIAALAGGFLRVIMWGMIPMIAANALRSVVSALGRPVYATAITALAIGVGALANYSFVFGHFGAPAMGLQGSALASVVTGVFGFLAYVVAIRADRRLRRYRLFGNWWRSEWRRFGELVRTGLPVAGTILAEAALFGGAAFLMGNIGASQLAGHTIAMQVAALAFQIPFGLGQAATIRVGYHFGARNPVAIGRAGWAAIAAAMGCMLVTASAMMFAPLVLLHIYIDPAAPENAALVRLASGYLIIAAGFQLADGMQAVAMGSLRGLQDTRVPMGFALFGYWVPGLATCLWLGFRTPLGGTGVWFGLALGLFVVALLMLQRWIRRERLGLLPA